MKIENSDIKEFTDSYESVVDDIERLIYNPDSTTEEDIERFLLKNMYSAELLDNLTDEEYFAAMNREAQDSIIDARADLYYKRIKHLSYKHTFSVRKRIIATIASGIAASIFLTMTNAPIVNDAINSYENKDLLSKELVITNQSSSNIYYEIDGEVKVIDTNAIINYEEVKDISVRPHKYIYKIRLSDGSEVVLNSNNKLNIPNSLEKGVSVNSNNY